jgi:hypothetical protein
MQELSTRILRIPSYPYGQDRFAGSVNGLACRLIIAADVALFHWKHMPRRRDPF